MLNSEKIKRYIFNPDIHINCAVAEYFNSSFSEDTEILNLMLDRYATLSDDEFVELFIHTDNLKPNMESLNKILSYLPKVSAIKKEIFEDLLFNTEVSLLKQIDLASSELSPDTRKSLENKLMLPAFTNEMLQVLLNWSAQDEDKLPEDSDFRLGTLIVRELSQRADLNENFIIKALIKTQPKDYSLYELHLLTLGGLRKMNSLIPLLLDCLRTEDPVGYAAQASLVRIGTSDVVSTIARRFYFENESFKILAIGVLENIKIPESEALLSRLLKEETDFSMRASLTAALCKHGNLFALEQLYELAAEDEKLASSLLDEYCYLSCLFNDEIIHTMDFLNKTVKEN